MISRLSEEVRCAQRRPRTARSWVRAPRQSQQVPQASRGEVRGGSAGDCRGSTGFDKLRPDSTELVAGRSCRGELAEVRRGRSQSHWAVRRDRTRNRLQLPLGGQDTSRQPLFQQGSLIQCLKDGFHDVMRIAAAGYPAAAIACSASCGSWRRTK